MTTLILIRHGQSETNQSKAFTGQLNAGLSGQGRMQAQRTADFVFADYAVEKVYASDLMRAVETAQPMAEMFGLQVEERPALREIWVPAWQGRRFSELQADYPEESTAWFDDIGHFDGVGGETMVQLAKRIEQELTELCRSNPGRTIAAVTHATPIRAMMTIWSGHPIDDMKGTPWVCNASVTEAIWNGKRFRLGKCGLCGHLADMLTTMPDRSESSRA